MECRKDPNPISFKKTAAKTADGVFGVKQGLCRKFTERADDLGLDDLDLPVQDRTTSENFAGQRTPVLGWTACKTVGDVDVFPLQLHRLNDLRE